jgi:hypothetical protein
MAAANEEDENTRAKGREERRPGQQLNCQGQFCQSEKKSTLAIDFDQGPKSGPSPMIKSAKDTKSGPIAQTQSVLGPEIFKAHFEYCTRHIQGRFRLVPPSPLQING